MAPISLLVLLMLTASSQGAEPRSDTQPQTAGSQKQSLAAPKVLKLERQSVMLPQTAARAGRRKNFYSAKVQVGEPAQEFHMTFDLGGGTMILPSSTCTDEACLERRRYDRWISKSAEDIQANGQLVEPTKPKTLLRRRDRGTLGMHSIDVGSGKVTGTFVRDQICIHGVASDGAVDKDPRCFPLAMLAANKMADMPFDIEPYDGAIGLGLNGMSISPEFNFLAAFHTGYRTWLGQRSLFPNSFGLHIGSDEDGGEITFGGYDDSRLTHPLKWSPVADPQEGRWQVAITAIRMGNSTIEACQDKACRAAIDYSSSLLAVPSKLAMGIEDVLAKLAPRAGFGDGCQHLALPDLHLELQNDVTLTLPAEDWVSELSGSKTDASSCKPLLSHNQGDEEMGQDLFVLGESTLRRYYTFFNADSLSVGFSLAAGSLDKNGVPALPSGRKQANKGKDALDDENPVILLVQVKIKRSKTVSSLK
jgi:saccharopepsin